MARKLLLVALIGAALAVLLMGALPAEDKAPVKPAPNVQRITPPEAVDQDTEYTAPACIETAPDTWYCGPAEEIDPTAAQYIEYNQHQFDPGYPIE